MSLNGINLVAQIAMAWFSESVTDIDVKNGAVLIQECYGLKNALYLLMVLHIINGVTCAIFLTGLDKYLCKSMAMVLFVVANLTVLGWAQTTYFKSMRLNCINMLPYAYLWLMFETLFFYIMLSFVICYFFRKYCQDPKVIEEE